MRIVSLKMENLYDILKCGHDVTHEELKRSYQELILKYHPDKNEQDGEKQNTETFVKINKAWKILGDPQLREQFDNRWNERCLARSWPLQETVDISEFTQLEPDENVAGEEDGDMYSYNCRCGGSFLLSGSDIEMNFDIVCCDTCSLAIQINYEDLT